jgi:hypothetical protein
MRFFRGGNSVRTHRQLVVYETILQALREPGCPFCRFLKEFQAERLQNHPQGKIHHLCNFHAWGFAAVQNAANVADVFIHLINEFPNAAGEEVGCRICEEVLAEENLRMREFVGHWKEAEVALWLRNDAVLCMPHGLKLKQKAPLALAARVDEIMSRNCQILAEQLEHLRDEPDPDRVGWGALGRAAEFLVA